MSPKHQDEADYQETVKLESAIEGLAEKIQQCTERVEKCMRERGPSLFCRVLGAGKKAWVTRDARQSD